MSRDDALALFIMFIVFTAFWFGLLWIATMNP